MLIAPFAALLLTLAVQTPAPPEFAFFRESVLGTSFELRVRAASEAVAQRAEQRVLAEIDRLAAILSNHDPDSEFRRWQAGAIDRTPLSSELAQLLALADTWRVRTAGAFDPRVEIFIRHWKTAERLNRLPAPEELDIARALLQTPAYQVNPSGTTASRRSSCPLTLDGIAKGDILERACLVALQADPEVKGMLLNVGGDIRAVGPEPWTVAIAPTRASSEAEQPVAFVTLHNVSLATSGQAHRGFDIEGRHYSHIVDPRTGLPAANVSAAAVVAPRGADADALATAANVLDPALTLQVAASLPGVHCMIFPAGAEPVRSHAFPLVDQEQPPKAGTDATPTSPNAPASWGDTHELAVHLEINSPETSERGYRRPYVVVWVEDAEGHAVRTVVLWVSLGGSGPDRWLPDLSRWYRGDEVRSLQDKKNMVYSIARNTRPPGKHTVVWDGKDDKGKPLPPGEYTLSIEAAREHGTHQLMRKKISVGEATFTEDLKGNVEIKSAQIEYRPRAEEK